MSRLGALSLAVLLFAVLQTAACTSMKAMNTRVLSSVDVSPATADAQNFSGGNVPFIATGNFTAPPSPVKPLAVRLWTSSDPTIATVDPNSGVAQCVPGASGNATIRASAPSGGPDMPQPSTAVLVVGAAKLTCP